ncbi:MAG: polysaccharide pyruvyl transferase family protein [Oceanococcus sp.]
MKNLYFFSKPPIAPTDYNNFEDLLKRSGANTGNFFFMRAVERQLKYKNLARGNLGQPEQIADNFDAIVIPAANWLSANNQFLGTLANRIEKSKLPCVVIGLGAQAPSDQATVTLSEGSKRFLKVVSERSHSISVRGSYTAEVINSVGVKNVNVTGCPSYFWSLSRQRKIRRPILRGEPLSVSVNASRKRRVDDSSEGAKLRVERDLYIEALNRHDSFFVAQTELSEGELALGQQPEKSQSKDWKQFRAFLGKGINPADYTDRFRVYCDIEKWIADLKQVDLVIGTRLHGCLLGMAAGTPSILVTIDSRTNEIARHFGIPHYAATETRLYLSLEDLAQSTDFSTMARRYPVVFDNYRQFLIDNALPNHLKAPLNFLPWNSAK